MSYSADGSQVSVIVAAFNEERHIGRLLRSLREQSLQPHEVIVVDDGSSDRTASIAKQLGAIVIKKSHDGPAKSRNAGATTATGEILVFVDGDMTCSPTFLERLTAPIVREGAVGTFSRDIFVGQPANAWSRSYCFIRRLGYPRLLPPTFPSKWANYRAVLRQRFVAAGGYDDVGYGEDMTLAAKLGELATVAPGADCWHFNPDSLGEIFENARWIGRGHDVQFVPHPVRDNLPTTALLRGVKDLGRGAPLQVLVARQVYSVGFILGMIDRRRSPCQHAK